MGGALALSLPRKLVITHNVERGGASPSIVYHVLGHEGVYDGRSTTMGS
jgi:hypothetical protein